VLGFYWECNYYPKVAPTLVGCCYTYKYIDYPMRKYLLLGLSRIYY
jgi:hypothetical protein